MQRFDCLAADAPLLGWHLLEASAGTGKTFAIEHIFARLLLEGHYQVEEILVVTFTRAATRQLKERIHQNLVKIEKILSSSEEEAPFPYLAPLKDSVDALRRIRDALRGFDRVCIFTIHGFCFRMMQEFALETNFAMSQGQEISSFEMTKRMKKEAISFLKKEVSLDILCPEQISFLLSSYDTLEDLAKEILRSKKEKAVSFSESHKRFQKEVSSYMSIDDHLLIDDFLSLKEQYKGFVAEFESHVKTLGCALSYPGDPCHFRKLLREKGDIFRFVSLKNRKVKAKEVSLHYPRFFEWAELHIAPIIDEAISKKNILANVYLEWEKWEETVLFNQGICSFDAILSWMAKAINIDVFKKNIASRFQAVMIDEFQDTDPLQWDIFREIFLKEPCKTIYLVGDPKQSIYRFRSADVYTYFFAKNYLGKRNCYHLDTNYRSTQEMVGSLNALFSRQWLSLPQIGSNIEYVPVRAGLSISSDFQDEKKAVHWMVKPDDVDDEDVFFSYAALEIQKLNSKGNYSIAILVKDRYEMQRASFILKKERIVFVCKSHETLGQTDAFQYVRELFDAIFSPSNESASRIVGFGPFARVFEKGASYWRRFLEENGYVCFCHAFFDSLSLHSDFHQILEALLQWESKEGFSFVGLRRFLDEFETLDAEEGGRKEPEEGLNAVQILTLHVSKGLEFDVVFALGLASASSMKDEDPEERAEKLRQLYVGMTRAKLRLYVPLKIEKGRKRESPMHLFSEIVASHAGSFLTFLETLSEKESISMEILCKAADQSLLSEVSCIDTVSFSSTIRDLSAAFALAKKPIFEPSPVYIQSFSSLTKQKGFFEKQGSSFLEESLPRGKEVGNVVHTLLEELFSSRSPIWKDSLLLDQFIEKQLRITFLAPWTEQIQQMVRDALAYPLFGSFSTFTLKDLECCDVGVEMEFLYLREPHFIKGFIDLVFCYENKLYFLDWKTNVLDNQTVEEAMKEHEYDLQASLYTQALERYFDSKEDFQSSFGGAFYCFIRERKWHYV